MRENNARLATGTKLSARQRQQTNMEAKQKKVNPKIRINKSEDGTKLRYACKHCKSTFGDRPNLYRHMNMHKGIRYNCIYCDKVYKRSDHVRNHLIRSLNLCSELHVAATHNFLTKGENQLHLQFSDRLQNK